MKAFSNSKPIEGPEHIPLFQGNFRLGGMNFVWINETLSPYYLIINEPRLNELIFVAGS